ncbi:MAG: SDR family NAD(P)-dependent oxidoreductase [Bdellovibrionales bacterium]|nr:SDR family NAD(P)-dependent oxidoreductase [Bdellovibrionales bacterium]
MQIETQLHGRPVLVTGATGFVGGHLTRRLLALGAKVRVLVRDSSAHELVAELETAGAELVFGDVTDRDSVFEAVGGCEYVFHIAALFRQAKHPDQVYYDINVEGTRNVLDAAEQGKVRRVVHCSTVGVHSHIPNPPADEAEDYRPGDIYQVTKCEGEKLALERFRSGRVEGVVVRPAMIWGEGDLRMLKLFRGVQRRRFPIIGSGKTLTHWVYVHDLVQGFLLAATHPEAAGQIYIFAGRRPASIEELVETIADKAGVSPLPVRIPAGPMQALGSMVEAVCVPFGIEPPLHRRRVDFFTKDRSFDTTKAQTELGYRPAQDFEQEVENIFNWYREHELLD